MKNSLPNFIRKVNLPRLFLISFTTIYVFLSWIYHTEVSKFVVGKYPDITGSFVARNHSVEFSYAVLFIIFAIILMKAVRGERRLVTFFYFYLYAAMTVLFYMFLSLHQVEIVHLIQYTSVAYLVGLCIDKTKEKYFFGKLLYIVISLGIIDEVLQYYVIVPDQAYLDFNDFFVNVLGAIFGTLLFYGFRRAPAWKDRPLRYLYRTNGFSMILIITIIISSLYFLGHIKTTPQTTIPPGSIIIENQKAVIYLERRPGRIGHWQKHFVRGDYYTLKPLEGMALIFFLGFLFTTYDTRFFTQIGIKSQKLEKLMNN